MVNTDPFFSRGSTSYPKKRPGTLSRGYPLFVLVLHITFLATVKGESPGDFLKEKGIGTRFPW